jgi:hypothetical protein
MVQTFPAVRGRPTMEAVFVPIIFTAAAAVGGSAMGFVIGSFGELLRVTTFARALVPMLAAVAALGALAELGIVRAPRPQRRRQVPSGWRARFPPRTVAALYGFLLGGGLFTPISHWTFYVLVLTALIGGPLIGSGLLGIFGLGRAAAALMPIAIVRNDPNVALWALRLGRWNALPRWLHGIYLSVLAISLVLVATAF